MYLVPCLPAFEDVAALADLNWSNNSGLTVARPAGAATEAVCRIDSRRVYGHMDIEERAVESVRDDLDTGKVERGAAVASQREGYAIK